MYAWEKSARCDTCDLPGIRNRDCHVLRKQTWPLRRTIDQNVELKAQIPSPLPHTWALIILIYNINISSHIPNVKGDCLVIAQGMKEHFVAAGWSPWCRRTCGGRILVVKVIRHDAYTAIILLRSGLLTGLPTLPYYLDIFLHERWLFSLSCQSNYEQIIRLLVNTGSVAKTVLFSRSAFVSWWILVWNRMRAQQKKNSGWDRGNISQSWF